MRRKKKVSDDFELLWWWSSSPSLRQQFFEVNWIRYWRNKFIGSAYNCATKPRSGLIPSHGSHTVQIAFTSGQEGLHVHHSHEGVRSVFLLGKWPEWKSFLMVRTDRGRSATSKGVLPFLLPFAQNNVRNINRSASSLDFSLRRRAFSFLRQTWFPCERISFNKYSKQVKIRKVDQNAFCNRNRRSWTCGSKWNQIYSSGGWRAPWGASFSWAFPYRTLHSS